MARLIEVENVIRVIDRYINDDDTNLNIKLAITNIPKIEAEPLRHGHWEDFICSVCGQLGWDEEDNYCPNCGAKMDEEEDGGTVTYYANDKPVETIVIDERKEYAKTN